MTAVIPRPIRPYPVRRSPRGAAFLGYLRTSDVPGRSGCG
jgi:hypothetical protein